MSPVSAHSPSRTAASVDFSADIAGFGTLASRPAPIVEFMVCAGAYACPPPHHAAWPGGVPWHPDPEIYARRALAPAKVAGLPDA